MRNNKLMKGALAGATGVALLLGGFGSFALWSDQTPLPNASVNSGELSFAAVNAVWTDASPDATDTSWDPATDKMVPGDTVTLTQDVTVRAQGKNLEGLLALDISAIESQIPVSAADDFTVTMTTGGVAGFNPTSNDNEFRFASSAVSGGAVTFPVTVTFALDAAAGDDTQNFAVDLSTTDIDLTQVRPGS